MALLPTLYFHSVSHKPVTDELTEEHTDKCV